MMRDWRKSRITDSYDPPVETIQLDEIEARIMSKQEKLEVQLYPVASMLVSNEGAANL